MLFTVVIGGMIRLSIATTLLMTNRYQSKLTNETGIQNDLFYGLKMMKNRVRQSDAVTTQAAGGSWLSTQLICDNKYAFGIYQPAQNGPKYLVYLPDKTNVNNRTNIFNVAAPDSISFDVTLSGRLTTIRVHGTRNSVPFDLGTSVQRRG